MCFHGQEETSVPEVTQGRILENHRRGSPVDLWSVAADGRPFREGQTRGPRRPQRPGRVTCKGRPAVTCPRRRAPFRTGVGGGLRPSRSGGRVEGWFWVEGLTTTGVGTRENTLKVKPHRGHLLGCRPRPSRPTLPSATTTSETGPSEVHDSPPG